MALRILKFTIILLLVFYEVEVTDSIGFGGSGGLGYQCSFLNQPANCANTTRSFKVNKTRHSYQIFRDGNKKIVDVECQYICYLCEWVTQMDRVFSCGFNQTNCELRVDNFMNSYCWNITLATTTTSPTSPTSQTCSPCPAGPTFPTCPVCPAGPTCPTCPVIAPSQCSQTSQTSSDTTEITDQTHCQHATSTETNPAARVSSSSAVPMKSPTSSSVTSSFTLESTGRGACTNSVAALGALLGISIALLAVVTAGWVCTCVIVNKRQSQAEIRKGVVVYSRDDEDDEDGVRVLHNPTYESSNVDGNRGGARALQNPTYEVTSSTIQLLTSSNADLAEQDNRSAPTDTYDTLQPPSQAGTEKGQIYNVLDRGNTTGSHSMESRTRDVEQLSGHEDYSELEGPS